MVVVTFHDSTDKFLLQIPECKLVLEAQLHGTLGSYNRDLQVPSLLLSSDSLVLPLAPIMLPPALSMLRSGSTYGTLRSQGWGTHNIYIHS